MWTLYSVRPVLVTSDIAAVQLVTKLVARLRAASIDFLQTLFIASAACYSSCRRRRMAGAATFSNPHPKPAQLSSAVRGDADAHISRTAHFAAGCLGQYRHEYLQAFCR